MKKTRTFLIWAAFILLLLDLAYTFKQYYHAPLDGDMPAIIVPDKHYQAVMNQPFGWKAIKLDSTYAGVNRFFAHQSMYQYYRTTPLLLQLFLSPVQALYTAKAIFHTFVHALLIFLLILYAQQSIPTSTTNWLLSAILIFPLFQSGGLYYNLMAVVERAPTYAFFYAFPMLLLIWFYYPAYKQLFGKQDLVWTPIDSIVYLSLAIVLPFSGPLIPGVVGVVGMCVILRCLWKSYSKSNWKSYIYSYLVLPGPYLISIILLYFLCVYSLYLGQYNAEQNQTVSLIERYGLLGKGIIHQFTNKPGPAILLLLVIGNTLLIKYVFSPTKGQRIISTINWIALFSILYLLLLPLGGYREYRPMIVRRDAILPVFLMLFYYWGSSGAFIIRQLSGKWKALYTSVVFSVLLIFVLADEPAWSANQCERQVLEKIAKAPEKANFFVKETPCLVLSWDKGQQERQDDLIEELLRVWKITN